MDKERMRQLREELAAQEAGVRAAPVAPEAVATLVPPLVRMASPAARSDSEETHDSLTRKRSRPEKSVTIAVPSTQTTSVPDPASLIPSLENLKITTPITLASVLYTLSHAHRLAAEYAGSLDAEIRSYKDRVKDLQSKNSEAYKVIKQEKAALVRKDGEIEKGKNEVLRLTQELESGKKKVDEFDALFQRCSELESLVKTKDIELQSLKEEVRKLEIGSLRSYESGYEEALKHLKHVHPDEDVSKFGSFHEIIDGQLVDPDKLKGRANAGIGSSSDGTKQ